MIKKVIIAVVLLIGIGAGSILIYKGWRQNQEIRLREEEVRQQLIPIQQEKRALLDQLTGLQRQYDGKMKETATIQFVFSQLDSVLYDDIFPAMLQYGFSGVLVLSAEECPGLPGKITVRQFDEMMRDGWTYCLHWDGKMDLWDAFTAVQWSMPESSIEMPDTVYMDDGTLSEEADTILKDHGIRMVIHHGENGLPIDISDLENSLWHIGSVLLNGTSSRNDLKNCVDKRTNLVFDIRFRPETGNYDSPSLRDLIQAVAFEVREKRLEVTNFAGVKELYQYEEENYRRVRTDDLTERMNEIQTQIDELDKQINAISMGKEYLPANTTTENVSSDIPKDALLIRSQIERYEKEHPLQIAGKATAEIIFAEPSLSVYTEAFPQLQLQQAPGVICIRPEAMPGMSGCITIEQWEDLEKHGWETCLYFDGKETFSGYYQRAQSACEKGSITFPHAVYVADGYYNSELAALASDLGLDVVIHHGEESAILDYPPENGIWTAGCIDWNRESDLTILTELTDMAGNLAICIHSTDDDHFVITSGLSSLLEVIAEYVHNGQLLCTGFKEGKASQEESRISREQLNAERNEYLEKLLAELESIENP